MASNKMTKVSRGTAMELIMHLNDSPLREKDPKEMLGLSNVFSMPEFLAASKSYINKGYTYDDLTRLINEKCKINVPAKRIKHAMTYADNAQKNKHKKQATQPVIGTHSPVENIALKDFSQMPVVSQSTNNDIVSPQKTQTVELKVDMNTDQNV